MVALTALTGRRERPCSSPRAGKSVQPRVESSARPRRTPPESDRRPVAGRPPDAADQVDPEPPPTPGRSAPAGVPTPTAAPPGARRRRTPRGSPPPAPHRPLPDGTQTGQLPRVVTGRRRTILMVLAAVALVSAAALVVGLLSWAPEPTDPPRALTVEERTRLAAVRVTNYRDLRAGVRLTAGTGAERTELVGWVDWSRPLVYLDVGGPGAGTERGLLQATPSAVMLRPDPAAVPTPAPPPLVPPGDRWRLTALPAGGRLAPVLDLLFGLAADRPDAPAPDTARWTARTDVEAERVDVLEAPLPAPSGASPPPVPDGRWWVDGDARLHRLEARLPGAGPVSLQLNRTDRPTLRPVDALGGRPGAPRTLTTAERHRLERLPARLRGVGGATVTLTAPLGPGTNLQGAGWVSWSRRDAYLAVADLGGPGRRTLVRHDAGRATRTDVPAATVPGTVEAPARPPLPVPARGWRAAPADDLTALVDAALRATTAARTGTARRIRGDSLAGTSVDVVELRASGAQLRYWLDRSGLLRRLELRTRAHTWAQLDLTPGSVPRLAAAPPGTSGTSIGR
ncbi:hypothetical protein ACTMS0_08125 [Micromonospora sp. H33]|uniref:hypothetical protein n=1 Tax=Micromonospora sp. H33 TaxID=3452215 RepID=UPI003F88BC22